MKQKIKIMNPKPELPDDEIRSYMDFEGLLIKHKAITSSRFGVIKWSVMIATIGILSYWIFWTATKQIAPSSSVEIETLQIVNDSADNTETPIEILPDEPNTDVSNHTDDVTNLEKPKKEVQKKEQEVERKPAEELPKQNIYVQAEPLDGYPALYEYFTTHLVYPAEALKDSLQGVVTVSFVINTKGKPEKIEINQSLGEPFEREARRLIENMPLWNPATLNGNPVSSRMSLPLTFQIQRIKNKN